MTERRHRDRFASVDIMSQVPQVHVAGVASPTS
jgi:hypothetical protein